jgi:ABC-type multidrug transport system ATPase subunit
VQDLTFTVRPGHVTGFLGPNGAGKSTTLRLILGLNSRTAGTVTVSGRRFRDRRRGLRHVGALLDEVGLADAARRRIRGYSLGMRQRLGIAAALLGDPPIRGRSLAPGPCWPPGRRPPPSSPWPRRSTATCEPGACPAPAQPGAWTGGQPGA